MKQFLVQKFGGTSVGFPERLASLRDIVKKFKCITTPILVVSAVSGVSKTEGTTTLLLCAIDKACNGEDYFRELELIESQHTRLVQELRSDCKQSFLDILKSELANLNSFLSALSTIGEKSARSIDFILSFGERLSAHLVTQVLRSDDINVRMCDLSRLLDGVILDESLPLYDQLSTLISTTISPIDREVLVVTGFFGFLPDGILAQVGRGYSDLTAALIARGLGCEKVEELQIWKEVDGVFSADPRKVPSAKVLSEISASEAVELTFFGSEVLHPHTMEQVISKNIPIRVLNSLKPEAEGTIIRRNLSDDFRAPTAVTVKKGVIVLSLTSNRMYDAKGFLAHLFEILREGGLVVDLVSTSEVNVSCTVNDFDRLNKAIPRLEQLGEVRILDNRAILAVVGTGLSEDSNSIGKMFSVLSQMKIYPEMITQAESRTSISCVLKESEVEKALGAVHSAIFS